MDIKTYSLEIDSINQDLEILINRKIYEIDTVPGNPTCNKVGTRLQSKINILLNKIAQNQSGDIEKAAACLNNNKQE